MKEISFAAITFDNGLLIALIGLVAGGPGLWGFLVERTKAKSAEAAVKIEIEKRKLSELSVELEREKWRASQLAVELEREKRISYEATVKRLEITINQLELLITNLQNIIIARDDGSVTDPPTEPPFGTGTGDPNPVIVRPSDPSPIAPLPSGQIPGPSGKYVVWMSVDENASPRYVLLTWETTDARIGYRIRDYVGGVMLHPAGAAPKGDPRFQSRESPMTLDDLWSNARCHIRVKMKGELDHKVEDFSWWRERLGGLTAGHERGHALSPAGLGDATSRNVLLMLSSAQNPPPRTEVHWQATNCTATGSTFLATTRVLTGLTKDKSIVAFYGDVSLFNQVLGYGIFLDFIRADSIEGQQILESDEHYRVYGKPEGVLGLIHMRDFQELPEGTCLENFYGSIDAQGVGNGRPLTLLNLPEGAARAQVYYRKAARVASS